jgi:hypothetical protein
MKRFLLLIALISSALAARADMVMQEKAIQEGKTFTITVRIHGDMVRMDQADDLGATVSTINDFKTHDEIMLKHRDKTVLKHSGAKLKDELELIKKRWGETNAALLPPAKPVATGKSEKVGDYDAEIYLWTGPGVTKLLWVAKDYPNFSALKPYLARIDQFNETGVGRGLQPDIATLPGMVVKTETDIHGSKVFLTLISAKEAPVDPSIFEVPASYTDWKPPAPTQMTNAAAIPAK